MTDQEFAELNIGDKVCVTYKTEIWGYVEDKNVDGSIEFDTSESIPLIPNKDTEIKVNYKYVMLLEKKKSDNEKYSELKLKYDLLVSNLMRLLESA